MIDSLLNMVFFCAHRRTTFPQTPTRNSSSKGALRTGTYVVCLDCGKEFPYSWKELKIERPSPPERRPQPEAVPTPVESRPWPLGRLATSIMAPLLRIFP